MTTKFQGKVGGMEVLQRCRNFIKWIKAPFSLETVLAKEIMWEHHSNFEEKGNHSYLKDNCSSRIWSFILTSIAPVLLDH